MSARNDVLSNSIDIAGWRVDVLGNRIRRGQTTVKLEPKVMRLLACLAARPGEVVTREGLLEAVWPGVVVTDDALTGAIIKLRKAFSDRPRQSRVIETIPIVNSIACFWLAMKQHRRSRPP